jgi:protein Mpv17
VAVTSPLIPVLQSQINTQRTKAVFGPAATTWFAFLQRRVVLSNKYTTIGARVALDQLLFTPTNLACFLSSMALMEGSSPAAKLKSTYATALKKNWQIWPGVQFVNFAYVPLEFRVFVVNIVSLGWNCYLSYLNSQGGGGDAEEKKGQWEDTGFAGT